MATPARPILASIWAQDRHGALGDGHAMVWHVPADFRYFKARTLGHPVIMGRASFDALGAPLPGRSNIVLTRDPLWRADGVIVAHSLSEARDLAAGEAERRGVATIWVAGGASVYRDTMGLVDRLFVTELDLEANAVPGSHLVYAPPIDPDVWRLVESESDTEWREKSGDARWRVRIYERRN